MKRRNRALAWLTPGAGIVVLLSGVPVANAQAPQAVDRWVARNAVPLATIDPAAPLDDLATLRRPVGNAAIVGLGESIHGTAEETALKLRTLRFLVERMGFRSIAWEEDWTMGLKINEYIRTGKGDADALAKEMSFQYRTRPVADVLRWLRDYNAAHDDKVQFVGVEYYYTRPMAYDAIDAYVAKVAPERLPELREHLAAIKPSTEDMQEYATWYDKEVKDKRPYVRHAHRVRELVEQLPHGRGDREHALALHHAQQIESFYVHFTLEFNEQNAYRDAHAARNLKWWRAYSGGDKVVYWAASAHTANMPELHITAPEGQDFRYPTAGSHLRRWYGRQYRSLGFTFDHGTVSGGPGQTITLPPPDPDWIERPFGTVGAAQFVLDLQAPAPAPVRAWLNAPARTRGLAHLGPGSYTTGGSLAQWFDVIVHRQQVTPAHPA
jgi:erythromycin esterase